MGRTSRAVFAVDPEDPDGTLKPHALLREEDDPLIILAERHSPHGGGELPYEETLARPDLPEAHRIVRCARQEEL